MVPGHDDRDRPAPRSPPTRPHASRSSPSSPELETLTFHPRPDADGLVARLGSGTLVPPHPADADRVTPGEAWACTLARGPGGGTVARLVARVEPASPGNPTPTPDAGAGGEAPSPSPTGDRPAPDARGAHGGAGGPSIPDDAREQLERRRRELTQREEMLEAQLHEVRERLLDLDEMLGE